MLEVDQAGYLPPQADRISTVATVVDAIAAGCDTAASIATGIGMSQRQGAYYPHAAAALGYVAQHADTVPATWTLTAAGAEFVTLTAELRAVDLVGRLAAFEELSIVTASAQGHITLAEQWSSDGYSEATIGRRLRTLAAWAEFLAADVEDQTQRLGAAIATCADFAPAAATALAEARRAQARVREQVFGAVCAGCFTTKPLTGVCDTCD